jgi:ATP-binding cassette subfamily C (CFTR/MRP) protein 1
MIQALARAIYSRKPILLLDDIFSGLDDDTADHIFNALFGISGLFKTVNLEMTVVLSTHIRKL